MSKRILIDTAHPEETRVAVVAADGTLSELDFESQTKQTIKGNIYLAKITRVEPSLQAAFIDFGGERHGFLPFTEIHPDYFRIPVDDRRAIENQQVPAQTANQNPKKSDEASKPKSADGKISPESEPAPPSLEQNSDKAIQAEAQPEKADTNAVMAEKNDELFAAEIPEPTKPATTRRPAHHQRYKIQEVIQRNQILLVQAVKETRGSKGAAFTTNISLAGRYCVLMPNSPQGGGISRKIASPTDRTRLKEILNSLELPSTMGLIIRTAGRERNKNEIKRDSDYLIKTWDKIRKQTLQSVAPALIYEEASLVKRSIRDFYTSDIKEIWIEGSKGFIIARSFMKDLLPSHVKRIHEYKDPNISLFQHFGVHTQIDRLYSPEVPLPSGGSLVINPTEALVSIDINSGRATRERHIEETAYKTNLEAAAEIARQLRLRDLAGLIVIDFIDMENPRHNRSVEQKLTYEMQGDRARTQIGNISQFGLLELSRQRLRPSIIESSASPCPQCSGSGFVRSIPSTAAELFRDVEKAIVNQGKGPILVKAPPAVVSYICNEKRYHLIEIEKKHLVPITILAEPTLAIPNFDISFVDQTNATHNVPSGKAQPKQRGPADAITLGQPDQKQKSSSRGRRGRRRPSSQKSPGTDAQATVTAAPGNSNTHSVDQKSWWRRLLD